jgi:hypothetical protein
MANACQLLANHIEHLPIDEDLYSEMVFLRTEMSNLLRERANQRELELDYENYKKLEVQNPWLRELTQRYFD